MRFSSRAGHATKFEKNRITFASKKSLMWPRLNGWKDLAVPYLFNLLFSVWKSDKILFLVFDTLCEALLFEKDT